MVPEHPQQTLLPYEMHAASGHPMVMVNPWISMCSAVVLNMLVTNPGTTMASMMPCCQEDPVGPTTAMVVPAGRLVETR